MVFENYSVNHRLSLNLMSLNPDCTAYKCTQLVKDHFQKNFHVMNRLLLQFSGSVRSRALHHPRMVSHTEEQGTFPQ